MAHANELLHPREPANLLRDDHRSANANEHHLLVIRKSNVQRHGQLRQQKCILVILFQWHRKELPVRVHRKYNSRLVHPPDVQETNELGDWLEVNHLQFIFCDDRSGLRRLSQRILNALIRIKIRHRCVWSRKPNGEHWKKHSRSQIGSYSNCDISMHLRGAHNVSIISPLRIGASSNDAHCKGPIDNASNVFVLPEALTGCPIRNSFLPTNRSNWCIANRR